MVVISNSKSYGVPLYGSSWLPLNLTHHHDHDHDESPPSINSTSHVVLSGGGGGGEGNSGIPNALLISDFNVNSNSLSDHPDERFGFCRFLQSIENHQILYVTAMQGKGGSIVKWNTTSWTRISSKHITRDSITTFSVSADGKYIAVGTMEGDILVLHSSSMRVHTVVKKAHLGILTSLMFSHDSRALLSTSFDSSARVTLIDDKEKRGWSLWVILFILLLAMAVYYARLVEMLP